MMATKVRRLPLVVSGVQGGICFTDCVADWVRNRCTVSAASCPDVSRWKFACKWRWKGERFAFYFSRSRGPLRYVSCHSRVTRVSPQPLCENEVPEEETAVSTCRERLKRPWRWVPFTADWLAGCLTSLLTSWVLISCLTDWLMYRSTW